MPSTLEQFLLTQIREKGPISLGSFMGHALSHPEYGYYSAGDPFGVEGDFTTAPEISQMFGEMIGAWLIDIWMQMGQPAPFALLELGPGRGTLMADILRVAKGAPGFLDAAQIHLVEMSPLLQDKQKQALRGYGVQWHTHLDDVPEEGPVLIIGNEFLDALPVEQLKRTENGWQKRVIQASQNGSLELSWGDAEQALISLLPAKTQSNEVYEVSPARHNFALKCAGMIRKCTGAALFLDYGYIRRHHGDTVQAVRAHKFVDVLDKVGESDLTAHIDFETLRTLVEEQDMRVPPVVTQRAFLRTLGIDHRAQMLKNAALKQFPHHVARQKISQIDAALDRLTAPDQMGDLFKVFCFYSHANQMSPAGF